MSAPGLSPAERLVLSRERLRIAMTHPSTTPQGPGPTRPDTGLLDLLKSAIPGASLLIDTLGAWWERHPLHTTGLLADSVAASNLNYLDVADSSRQHPEIQVLEAIDTRYVTPFKYGQLNTPFEYSRVRYLYGEMRRLQVSE